MRVALSNPPPVPAGRSFHARYKVPLASRVLLGASNCRESWPGAVSITPRFANPQNRRTSPAPCTRATEVRSEEHTSELQSRGHIVCRLLLEKKNTQRSPPRKTRTSPTSSIRAVSTAARSPSRFFTTNTFYLTQSPTPNIYTLSLHAALPI